MASPQSDHPIDPEALARLVLQCREFHAHVLEEADRLPTRSDTPFLYRQLDEVAELLHATLKGVGGNAPLLMQDVRAPGFFKRLRKSFGRLVGGKPIMDYGQVDLQGNAWTIPTSEVIGFLANGHKTGVLWVHTYRENFMIEIRRGNLVHATSDRTPEGMRLGEILVERGFFTEQENDVHVAAAAGADEPLGSYLLRTGVIAKEELREALSHQVQALFHRLMRANNALYRFQEGVEVTAPKDLDLNVTHLLLESARQQDEETWRAIGNVLDVEEDGARPAELDERAA